MFFGNFKMFLKSLCLVLVLSTTLVYSESVLESFKSNEIVPDVIDTGPNNVLKVTFTNGAVVNLGNELTPTQVQNQPEVSWKDADPKSFYTLVMTDPDAPSRAEPKFREWHHWIVGNIPGNDIFNGEVLSGFISSAPPMNSGLHRYVFMLYKQPSGQIDFNSQPKLLSTSSSGRAKFSTRSFAKKYSLGTPVAGNFYQAEYDDYVPQVYAKLKN